MFRALGILCFLSTVALAAPKTDVGTGGTYAFQFRNADIVDAIQAYSKMTGQKFVLDAGARGKITIINASKVTPEEAFNLLSLALSTNGLAISEQGDTMVVEQARMTQRNLIPVVTELPALKPEKMVSWVVDFKNIDADDVNRQLRLITSNQGEVFPFGKSKMIVTDWVSNLYRVRDLFAQIDKPGYRPPTPMPVHYIEKKPVNPEQ